MSATMTPSSASYITTSAHLRNPVRIYQNIARPNITISGHKIQNGIHELNYLVLSTAFMIHQIPLGMVFADNINEGGAIARNLRTLLHPRLKARGDELIRVFNGPADSDDVFKGFPKRQNTNYNRDRCTRHGYRY
jgi:hypothetical protein